MKILTYSKYFVSVCIAFFFVFVFSYFNGTAYGTKMTFTDSKSLPGNKFFLTKDLPPHIVEKLLSGSELISYGLYKKVNGKEIVKVKIKDKGKIESLIFVISYVMMLPN